MKLKCDLNFEKFLCLFNCRGWKVDCARLGNELPQIRTKAENLKMAPFELEKNKAVQI